MSPPRLLHGRTTLAVKLVPSGVVSRSGYWKVLVFFFNIWAKLFIRVSCSTRSPVVPEGMEERLSSRSPFSSPRLLRSARLDQRLLVIPSSHPEARVRIALGATDEVAGLHHHHPPLSSHHQPHHQFQNHILHSQNQQHHPLRFHNNNTWDRQDVISLASIGMGSTDGRKLTIRRVPTSPSELLNIASGSAGELSSNSSYSLSDEWEAEESSSRKGTRYQWANKVQFILACVGYSVGLGNLWRFPYLCYSSGGGVFLIPYYLILVLCGAPLLYMELAIGQFTRRGPIGAFSKLCPLLKGAGISSVVVAFFMSTYYNVIIAYTLFFFFNAFRTVPPWNGCFNKWNTDLCWHPVAGSNKSRPNDSQAPAEEFFERKVLQLSSGIEDPGSIRWELAACLLFAWIFVYFALWKSVRSSGRVLYFTATLPFVLVLAFLGRSLTLDGADMGIRYLLNPKWESLLDAKVWVNAAAQNFYSIGIAFGSVVSFASYNRSNNRILIDTVTVSAINAITSLIVGLFAFATIGNIATEHQKSVQDVVADGPGLVFVIYPQALSKMPFSSVWAVLFFFMLFCLGLNSQFAIVEVVVTSIQDGFPNWVKKKFVCHEIVVLAVCVVSFIFGLPHVTQGGIYTFQLVDHYALSNSIMPIAFFEVIAIGWFYGASRLSKNVELMTKEPPRFCLRLCWVLAAPSFIMFVWVFSLIDYETPSYDNGNYVYPWWAEIIGWSITGVCLSWIPVMAVYSAASAEGKTFWKKLENSIKPRIADYEPPPVKDAHAKEKNTLLPKPKPNVKIVKSKSLDPVMK